MALLASFEERSSQKAKEWSPIDRMIAGRRGPPKSKSPAPRPQELPQLPQLSQQPPWRPEASKGVSSSTQTASWETLMAEAAAREKRKTGAVQAELKALRMQLEESEAGSRAAAARHALEAAELQAALAEARQAAGQVQRGSEAAEDEAEARREALRREAAARELACREDLTKLRGELAGCKDDLDKSRSQCHGLSKERAALEASVASFTAERDYLLERLEVEQAAMMARVEFLERRPSNGGGRPAKSSPS